MFDVLVESTSQRRSARMWTYFAISSVAWIAIFAATAIAGVMTYDARLDAEFDELGLVAYVPAAAPPREQPSPQPDATPRPPDRFDAPTTVPTTIPSPRPVPSSGGADTGGLPGGGDKGVDGGLPGSNGTEPAGFPEGDNSRAPQPVADPPQPPPDPQAEVVERPSRIISKGPLNGVAIQRVIPPYPSIARQVNVAGEVVVSVTVSEEGNVVSAQAIAGHPLLRDAAQRAAYGWKFTPTTLGGKPMRVVGTITFHFRRS